MCLLSSLGIFNVLSSLLEEKVFDLKGLPLMERNFELRESLDGRLGSLGRLGRRAL